MFDFVKVDFKETEVQPVNKDGVRFYKIPDTDKYFPSVTSITSFQNAQFFKEWRTKIGEQEANRITARATQRGTTFHSITEDYIRGNLDIDQYMENNPLAVRMFQSAKKDLNRISNIHCLETFLYSHYLGLAGRVDCIAEFDGELAVEVKKIVTLIATEEGTIQIFEKYNLDDYLQLLKTYISEFVAFHNG